VASGQRVEAIDEGEENSGGLGAVLTGVLAWCLGAVLVGVLAWRDPRTPLIVEHGEQYLPLRHVQEQSSTT
jgi:hypothetical protein